MGIIDNCFNKKHYFETYHLLFFEIGFRNSSQFQLKFFSLQFN